MQNKPKLVLDETFLKGGWVGWAIWEKLPNNPVIFFYLITLIIMALVIIIIKMMMRMMKIKMINIMKSLAWRCWWPTHVKTELGASCPVKKPSKSSFLSHLVLPLTHAHFHQLNHIITIHFNFTNYVSSTSAPLVISPHENLFAGH